MSFDATKWAWLQRVGRSSAKLVLLSIADRIGKDSTAHPSVSKLADDTELDRKTVMSCISYLIDKGIIKASKRNGASTTYWLVGFEAQEQTSTQNGTARSASTSPKNGTGPKNGTSPKNGIPPVPNLGPQPVPNLGHKPIINQSATNQMKSARGARLPLDTLPDDWMAFCRSKRPDLDPSDTWDRFRDYWIAQPGQRGCKADWYATWRNWVRNEKQGNGKPLGANQHAAHAFENKRYVGTPVEDIGWVD